MTKPIKTYAIVFSKVPDLEITRIRASSRKEAWDLWCARYGVVEVEGDAL